jgi:uncharacterized protein YbaP (TraB family)
MDITRQDLVETPHVKAKKLWEEKFNSLTNEQIENISITIKKIFPSESETIDFNDNQEKSDFIFSSISKLKSKIYSELELFSGIDLQLIQQAKRQGKSIEDLETIEQYKQQAKITQTDIASDPIRDLFLQILTFEGLKDFNEASKVIEVLVEQLSIYHSKNLKPIFDAWEEGDLETLDHSKDDSVDKKMVMTQRNMNMAMKITRLVNDKEKLFCCVGASHTVGEMNIQDFLRNFGFSTERVFI